MIGNGDDDGLRQCYVGMFKDVELSRVAYLPNQPHLLSISYTLAVQVEH